MDTSEGRRYPPQGHLIRHLRMELELRDEHALHGSMPISDDLRDPGGALRTGALATTIDVAAGTFSHEMVLPDWLATTDMKLHVLRPAMGERVDLVTSTLRAGRRMIVSRTVVTDDEGEVARAWVTYARLPRRDDSPADPGSRIGTRLRYVEADESLEVDRRPLDEYLGLRFDPHELVIELDHVPRLHNSFGSLQGGAAATLVERAATLAVERRTGVPGRAVDLHLYYLGQTRSGPFRVEADVLRTDDDVVTVEVAILDAGDDGRLIDLGTATAVPLR